jgi:hypothetical protein
MRQLILAFLFVSSLILLSDATAKTYAQSSTPPTESRTAVNDGKAPAKEKLDYSYKILLDSYNKYLDNVFKTIGFLIVIIGWLITSDKSRLFFQENKWARATFLLVIVIMWLVHASSLFDNYVEGSKIMTSIEKLNYIESYYFDRYRPKLYKTIGSLVLDSALFALLFTIIYRLDSGNEKTAT